MNRNTPEDQKKSGEPVAVTPRPTALLPFSIERILNTPSTSSPPAMLPVDPVAFALLISQINLYSHLFGRSQIDATSASLPLSNFVPKKSHFFSPHQVSLMRDEFQRNHFPSREAKLDLVSRTGLNESQVNKWFYHERKRARDGKLLSAGTSEEDQKSRSDSSL